MNESNRNSVAIGDDTEGSVKASIAPNTVKAHRQATQQFEVWLAGRSPSDNLVANYITELYQNGKSPATINKIVASVKWVTKNRGLGTSDFSFAIMEKTLAGIRREGKNRGRGQVDGMTWEEVNQVCTLAEPEETVTGLRDSALIRLMSDCLLRISETVAIDVADVGSALTIHQSNTDLEEAAATLYIGIPTQEVIRRYCEAGRITNGPLFRRIRRGDNITSSRLSVEGARNAIKRRAREAGVEGFISGHSLRIGSAISLAEAGASVMDMQVAGRWKSPQMPAHYAHAGSAKQSAHGSNTKNDSFKVTITL